VHLEAFGKIILLGEHAVLDGAPALAMPLPGAMRGRISAVGDGGIHLNPHIGDARVVTALELLGHLIPVGGFTLDWEASVPPGAGLGASASLSFLLAQAAWRVAHPATMPDPAHLAAVTHELEHCFHGTPSGIDDAVVCLQSAVLLQRPEVSVRWPFPHAVQAAHLWLVSLPVALPLVVGFSGASASTQEMITRVKACAGPDFADTSGRLFDEAVRHLACRDLDALGQILCHAHEHLAAAGASTPALDRMVQLALAAGAFGAKLTGSGGGGCAIALCRDDNKAEVAQAWRSAGFQVLAT
jgi:mevalonate kinase